jgi:lipopolysaccharide biosynthesis glycosyltransferase
MNLDIKYGEFLTTNAVYYCIYGNINYSLCLDKSLESLNKTNPEIDVYVFTNTEYTSKLAKVMKADFPEGRCSAMAYRFAIGSALLEKYQNILHLDNDTLVSRSLDPLFESLHGEEIHFASEDSKGESKVIDNFWAGPLLSDEEKLIFSEINSICTGVFAATKHSAKHLLNCFSHVRARGEHTGECADQHAVCEYVIKNNAYTHGLQYFVNHMPQNGELHQSIYHFAGGVIVGNKPELMEDFRGRLCT